MLKVRLLKIHLFNNMSECALFKSFCCTCLFKRDRNGRVPNLCLLIAIVYHTKSGSTLSHSYLLQRELYKIMSCTNHSHKTDPCAFLQSTKPLLPFKTLGGGKCWFPPPTHFLNKTLSMDSLYYNTFTFVSFVLDSSRKIIKL